MKAASPNCCRALGMLMCVRLLHSAKAEAPMRVTILSRLMSPERLVQLKKVLLPIDCKVEGNLMPSRLLQREKTPSRNTTRVEGMLTVPAKLVQPSKAYEPMFTN